MLGEIRGVLALKLSVDKIAVMCLYRGPCAHQINQQFNMHQNRGSAKKDDELFITLIGTLVWVRAGII